MQRCLLAVTNIYPLLELSSFEYIAALVSRHLRKVGAHLLHSSVFSSWPPYIALLKGAELPKV